MWRARYLPAASTGCVPIAAIGGTEDRPFAATIRKAEDAMWDYSIETR
jgi:hypothetical protein